LSGQPNLANTLSMHTHEALAQRIVINYAFVGLSRDEVRDYVDSKLKSCGLRENPFAENALEALWASSGGSPRTVNSLAEKCLMIGCQKNAKTIDAEIVMHAGNEISLA
jgi:type II secretory pathway predicted ATPase ExeA